MKWDIWSAFFLVHASVCLGVLLGAGLFQSAVQFASGFVLGACCVHALTNRGQP